MVRSAQAILIHKEDAMPCRGCEERRKLILEQVAAINAAARARTQAFLAANPWLKIHPPNLAAQKPQDKRQQS
jgi:hypothetical protein